MSGSASEKRDSSLSECSDGEESFLGDPPQYAPRLFFAQSRQRYPKFFYICTVKRESRIAASAASPRHGQAFCGGCAAERAPALPAARCRQTTGTGANRTPRAAEGVRASPCAPETSNGFSHIG